MTTTLEHYTVIGMVERWKGGADVQVPGGDCWHCGTAIAYCVQIRHTFTGEQHEIGTTCAEKVGLDITAVKKLLAEKRARERAAAELEWRRTYVPAEPTLPAHGTVERFHTGCHCGECTDGVVLALPQEYNYVPDESVIVELATGELVRASITETRYGFSWKVRGGEAWLPLSPKRRSTHANKGFVEAKAPCLVKRWTRRLNNGFTQPATTVVRFLGSPLVDVWGTPIPHKTVS
jgi:hypothetical protein